jgi:putative hydroxymethylpyrimidine transport system ATP-binding protein
MLAEEEVNKTTIAITNSSLSFKNKPVFSTFNLTLSAGKWIALLGPSGVGKTSLLRLIAGLIPNANVTLSNAAYMAQSDLLLPWLNVLDNVLLGATLRSSTCKHANKQAAIHLLSRAGLKDFLHYYPHELSGGMRQRVALVRTLVENKPIVLMDEPFSALDTITRFKLHELATELLQDKTVLFVTHDPLEALRMAHEIYILAGNPANIKRIAQLESPIPRDLSHTEINKLQAHLFSELTKASENAA